MTVIRKFFPEMTEEDDKKCWKLFRRLNLLNMSWENMNGQARGTLYAIHPFLDELYKDDPEELQKSYARNMKYFNTSNNLSGFIMGLVLAMEEKRARAKDVTSEAISAVRVSLCGPLAGIGDTLCQGTLKILVASIAMSLAESGNILGPVLFIALYGGILAAIWIGGTYLGYNTGTKFLDRLFEGGMLGSITKAAGVLGLCMIGAMTANNVTFALNATVGGQDLMELLNSIIPGFMPIVLTFGVYGLIKKKVNLMWIVYGIMAGCIVLAALGLV